jgi:ubiquinone/menaquinone biosynthesis C-methylase UbiE
MSMAEKLDDAPRAETLHTEERLRQEFNEWASDGRGEKMESDHSYIALRTMAIMDLKPGERVLDLSCGSGWATRLLARAVAGTSGDGEEGSAVGVDISDEMVRRARAASKEQPNALFSCGAASHIPWRGGYFDKALSIEAFYYYPDQPAVLRELWRVTQPDASIYLLINLYSDNPYSLRWVDELKVPVQVHSGQEYLEMLREAGFSHAEARHIPDLTPTPEHYHGRWFADAAEMREFKRIGSLLLIGSKAK